VTCERRSRRAKPKADLPKPGDVYLMPLGDGRFGVARILSECNPEMKNRPPTIVVVATSSWIGEEPPDITDPRLREILVATQHGWDAPQIGMAFGPVPESFRRIGTIEPSESESRIRGAGGGPWEALPQEVLMQWRWDNDRESFLRAEEVARNRWKEDRANRLKRTKEYLDDVTLDSLKKKRRFFEWAGDRPNRVIVACRKVFAEAIDAMIELGPRPKKRAVAAIVRRAVEKLNELDEQHSGFIETGERESLCNEIDEMVHAAGLRRCDGLADRWREW
jgi:hypothetical protein